MHGNLESGLLKDLGDNPTGGALAEKVDGKTDDDLVNFDRDKPGTCLS